MSERFVAHTPGSQVATVKLKNTGLVVLTGDNLYFSPDERFLLGFGEGHTLRVWRVADGRRALRDEPRGCQTYAYAFSPDGRRLRALGGVTIREV